MTERKKIIEVIDIHGGYGGANILHGVNIHLFEDEITVLLGPNGAGKSTIMRAILGQLKIESGKIIYKGNDITGTPPQDVIKMGAAFVPQTNNIFPTLSVLENLEMGAFIRNDNIAPRIQEIYEMFPPLYDKRHQEAGSLSGGQRQMVAMGKALMLDPEILMVDEPTAGLSPKFQNEILGIVKRVNSFHIPILMVEQNAKQALAIADRGYVLVDGQNRADDTGQGLLENEEIGKMFLGA